MFTNLISSIRKNKKGFSLIELIVSLGLFAIFTGLIVAKYGTFNQSVLLTNLAYDVALTIRTAQTYGLSVRNPDQTGSPSFNYAYGVNFNKASPSQFTFFVDRNNNSSYDVGEAISPSPYSLKRGATISSICTGSTSCTDQRNEINITFKRPDPIAKICVKDNNCTSLFGFGYAKIDIKGTDGSTRSVEVRNNGQISVLK